MNHSFKLTPGVIVFATAITVIFLSWVTPAILQTRIGGLDPRVSIAAGEAAEAEAKERARVNRYRAVSAVIEGEVARTETRLREATALGLAASLYLAVESMQGRTPQNVQSIISGMSAQGLFPPGVRPDERPPGAFQGTYGSLFIRYRRQPLGVEIVSAGRERMDGPVILIRVPDDGLERPARDGAENTQGGGAGVYQARSLEDVHIPPPFAPAAEVIADGFEPQHRLIR